MRQLSGGASVAIGYIYVMSNPKIPGLLKVGFTCGTVEKRRRELSGASGVPEEFVIDYFHLTEDAEETEGKVHADLDAYRVAERREFFEANLDAVITFIRRHVKEPEMRFERKTAQSAAIANTRLCGRCGAKYVRSSPDTLCPKCGF